MNVQLKYTSDWQDFRSKVIQISTLEELLSFQKKAGFPVIISYTPNKKYDFKLEIYDQPREKRF